MSITSSVSAPDLRPVLADAVEVARDALIALSEGGVGSYIGVAAEDECAATHRFEATMSGYRSWQWAVVVAAEPDSEHVTVSEVALLPGPDALVAPDWVPWDERVRAGDLSPGDLLAPPAGDPRLVPGYVANGDPEIDDLAREVGLGRKQVFSLEGRLDAAQRWADEFGPDSEMAKAAPSSCGLCGFYLPLSGSLHAAFGVCGNEMAADGRVVHAQYGCGAHSDTKLPTGAGSPAFEAYDDASVELIPASELTSKREPEPAAVVEPEAVVEVAAEAEDTADVDVAVEAEVNAEAEIDPAGEQDSASQS